MNPGTSSTPTDLDGLRRLMALITSESETGAKGKNSEDNNNNNNNNVTCQPVPRQQVTAKRKS
jgi:hypothetical protein